jgi:hypothetical protein
LKNLTQINRDGCRRSAERKSIFLNHQVEVWSGWRANLGSRFFLKFSFAPPAFMGNG